MRLLFAYDHLFVAAPDGTVRTRAALDDSVWKRYLAVFESLTVAARLRKARPGEDVGRLKVSSTAGACFVAVPSLSGPLEALTARPQAAATLGKLLGESDALIARLPSEIGALAVRLARRRKVPYAVEVVGCPWDGFWHHGSLLGRLYAPYVTWRTRRLVGRAPRVLYVTQRFLQRRYPTRGLSVGCSDVELPALDIAVLERRLEAIRSRGRRLRIGLIGSLGVKYKGHDVALRALATIRPALPEAELHFLGGGDPRPWRALADRLGIGAAVTFHGTLPGGDLLLAWLDTLDLYVQPSRQEGLPRALVEAMSRGCPAIGSTAGGIPELLPRECLVPPGDHAALAERITAVATDPSRMPAMARANVAEAEAYLGSELDVRRLEFIRGLAAEARSR